MKMKRKRIISIVLVLAMLITVFPAQAFASEKTAAANPFTDVSEKDWFYDAVLYAYSNDLFSGTDTDSFSPNDTMTRAMYVTVMGRMAGVNVNDYADASSFTDVGKNRYYAPYVEWAKDMKITSGTGDGKFSPDSNVTRQEMAAFTVRYFEAAGLSMPPSKVATMPADILSIADYAKDAVKKLWACGLFEGDQKGNFNPSKTATRAETATLLSRIDNYISNGKTNVPDAGDKKDDNNPGAPDTGEGVGGGSSSTGGGGGGGSLSDKYTISFDSNGGTTTAAQSRRYGSALKDLPIPYKDNSIFEGWCYDKELNKPVSSEDKLTGNVALYAKYMDTDKLTENFTPHFATAMDKTSDFTIKVKSTQATSTQSVKQAITAKNLSSQEQADFITVSGSGTDFVISGTNGFEEGANYKLTLNDDSLSFDGYEASVRDFNFSIAKDRALNFSLSPDIKYIPAAEITSITGNSSAPISLGKDKVMDANPSSGVFTYAGSLAVGDKVAIYEGVRPDLRTVDNDNDGDIMYVRIVSKNGNKYSYSGLDGEEVLFTPDVLPVAQEADRDGDEDNNSITVAEDVLDFADDVYQNVGLDSQTTVDKGDFIAFYSGSFGKNMQGVSYARITDVSLEKGEYIIAYEDVTQDEMLSSMDGYDKNDISGEEMLENVNVAAIEHNVEQQAMQSGFAEEAALYLASIALQTDSFENAAALYDLKDIKMEIKGGDDLSDGEVTLMDKSKVEVEVSKLQATLGTRLQYFEGYKGLRLTLAVGIDVTIKASDDANIVISIEGLFEQEARLAINLDGSAIWKWWGPFPYIAEYEATASVDLFDYTGIGITATMTTQEPGDDDLTGIEDEEFNDFAKELKDLLDKRDKYIGDGEDTVSDSLTDKYKEMLENDDSEWVKLFEKEIFSKEFRILLIFAVEIGINFVVSANINVTLGMDFYYANAKRYIYTVRIFAKNVTNEVIDIVEEQYQFEFYVLGTIGLRAGIQAEIKLGLLSTKLASVGFAAEAGAYVRIWGFFYYQLRWTASEGKSSKALGALLFELGIYLEITFEAQAFNGTFSYNPTLYENEWPILSAGRRENVQDFAYEEKDAEEITMKRAVRNTTVPDEIFEMTYLDLKEGEDGSKTFDDNTDFKIEMTNPAFTYNPGSNILSVDPGDKEVQEGQMIITWKGQPLAFSSQAIQRRIPLYWDNYNDGYCISFNSNGGSVVPIIIQRFEGYVQAPQNPTKQGYVFDSWYSNSTMTSRYQIPSRMPDTDTMAYAKWLPAEDTPYTVYHYTQQLNGTYELTRTDNYKGITGAVVEPDRRAFTGYATPAAQKLTIKADGSGSTSYYYKRATYTATFEPGTAGGDPVISRFMYGAAITAPVLSKTGYNFMGWDKPVANAVMADSDVTYTAQWEACGDTPYRVEHYVMDTDGKYKFKSYEPRTGNTDEPVNASELMKNGYEVEEDNAISYSHAAVGGETVEEAKITADGTLVLKLYYDRKDYDITFKPQNGESDIAKILKYDEKIILPEEPQRTGYRFGGWYVNEEYTAIVPDNMPAKSTTVYAKWEANTDTPYKIEHYVMDTTGKYPDVPNKSELLNGNTDTVFAAADQAVTSYIVPDGVEFKEARIGEDIVENVTLQGDGQLLLKLYYERKQHTLTWDFAGGEAENTYTEGGTLYYGQQIVAPELTKAGYSYAWDKIVDTKMPAEDTTYTAVWTANTDTPYKVEHYVMGTDGSYPSEPTYSDNNRGTTDSTLTLGALKKSDIEIPNGIEYKTARVGAAETETTTISGDGTLIVKLYYEREAYPLTWDIGEGTPKNEYTQAGNVSYGAAVVAPVLERAGYTYTWDKDIKTVMPALACSYTAEWVADTDTPYTVEHYQQNIYDDEYTLKDTENLEGTSDTLTDARDKGYTGFTLKSLDQANIDGSGDTVIKLYYDRDEYTLTLDPGEGELEGEDTVTARFGANVEIDNPQRQSYGFDGWFTDESYEEAFDGIMPADDFTLYAKWEAGKVSYKIEHYVMNTQGDYADLPNATETKTGDADDTVILSGLKRDSYEVEEGITYDKAFADEEESETATITPDGSLVVKLYYERSQHNLAYDLDGGTAENQYSEGDLFYDLPLYRPIGIKRAGYEFIWEGNPEFFDRMPARDLEYKTIWTPNTYTVTFSANGGTGSMDNQSFTYDEAAELSENTFEREGYDFTGWAINDSGAVKYENSETVSNLLAENGGQLSLYAVWEAIEYKVTYNSAYEKPENESYTITDGVRLPALAKTGYTFGGWFDNASCNGDSISSVPSGSTGNREFWAKWTENEYTITFDANGGTGEMSDMRLKYTDEKELTALDFNRVGCTFLGWATSARGLKEYDNTQKIKSLTDRQDANITLYAVWEPAVYNITYHVATDVDLGGTYTSINTATLPVPVRKGHDFVSWHDNEGLTGDAITEIPAQSTTGNKEYWAKWNEHAYTITYNANCGTGTMENQSLTYTEAKNLTKNEFSRTGYTFDGWAVAADGGKLYKDGQVVQYLVAADGGQLNLYAVWKLNIYDIHYELGGGADNSGNPVTYNVNTGAIKLGIPERTGYDFSGWYTDEQLQQAASDPEIAAGEIGDRTFYATWTARNYTVAFNANSGNGDMSSQGFTYGTAQALTESAFTRTGYDFAGWNTKADGTGTPYTNKQSVQNLSAVSNSTVTLYAQWKPTEYTLTWHLYGGVNGAGNPAKYTILSDDIIFADPTHSTEGHIFDGWYTNSNFTPESKITMIAQGVRSENLDIYAKWINYGTVSVKNNGDNTFTVSRTGGTDGAQTVSFRTVNGSAIGGTHFTHQDNTVTIPNGATTATSKITITEAGANAAYSSYGGTAFGNADREYFVELYQISGADGNARLGTAKAKRTLENSADYEIALSDLDEYKLIASQDCNFELDEDEGGDWDRAGYTGLGGNVLNNRSANLQNYIRATASGVKVQLRDFKAKNANAANRVLSQFVFFTNSSSTIYGCKDDGNIKALPEGVKCGFVLNYNKKDVEYAANLPVANTGTIGNVSNTNVNVDRVAWANGQTAGDYALYGVNEFCGIAVNGYHSAASNNAWRYYGGRLWSMPQDTQGPKFLGAAQNTTGRTYLNGDKVTVALIFDEIIASAGNVSVKTNLSDTPFTLSGGIGTNVLYFEGTVTKTGTSIAVDTPATDIANLASIKDLLGNSGRVQ